MRIRGWRKIQSVLWPDDEGQAKTYLVFETTVWAMTSDALHLYVLQRKLIYKPT